MVDELQFENEHSPWKAYEKDKKRYVEWAEEKKSRGRYIHPFITGTGLEYVTGKRVPMREREPQAKPA